MIAPDSSFREPVCIVCGADLAWVTCYECAGTGGFESDFDLDEEFEECETCGGQGGYLECPMIPHRIIQNLTEGILRRVNKGESIG
jgi:DnaJ-class molecular chaperone